jgi:hypothetical protein
MRTQWITEFYDPTAPLPPLPPKKSSTPPRVELIEIDPGHHLIYAAMLDGCCGLGPIALRLGLSKDDTRNALRMLESHGYVRMGRWKHHKAHVPCELGELK